MRQRDPNFITRCLRDFICGLLIGAGAILPGVSGGVLAVVFGLYQPFMEVLTHPKTALPKYWRFLPALGIGWVVGFFAFAKGISAAMELSVPVTTWTFIGLIVGTLPSLFREAGREGRGAAAWASFFLCAGLVFTGLFYVSHTPALQLQPSVWAFCLCGALWGLGMVVPGLATSSVLMALGLYQPLMEALSAMDFQVLAPALAGMAAALLLMARLVSWMFRRRHAIAFHGILGIVTASTLVILPTKYGGREPLLSLLCGVAGFLLAFFLARLDRRSRREEAK